MPAISVSLSIAISLLRPHAVGATIEDRFEACIEPDVLAAACWMGQSEDEQFRAAVGAVMLSYVEGSPEFVRIETEMRGIQKFSAMLTAAEAGLSVELPDEGGMTDEPIGLLGIWAKRIRR